MIHRIVKFFDRLEDHIRGAFSHFPIFYAFIGGALMILFWRGIWHTGDILMARGGLLGVVFYEPYTVVWTAVLMLLVGLFVSFFIGDHILISGLQQEKKLTEKTEKEIEEEEGQLSHVGRRLQKIEADIEEIKNLLSKK